MASSLDDIIRKVMALIERADHPNTPEGEAATARETAERLMRKYRIEEEQLIASDATALVPEFMNISICQADNQFATQYYHLFWWLSEHAECRVNLVWAGGDYVGQVVGYASDIRYLQVMYASARLVFQQHLEPEVDRSLSDAENAYRLRSAGIERNRIAHLLWNASMDSDGAAYHRKAGKLYQEECLRRGEEPKVVSRSVNAKLYRKVYADTFVNRLRERLRRARDAADQGTGGIVLYGRKERVAEAFYERFPQKRPSTTVAKQDNSDKGKKAKQYRPTKADWARWERETSSPSALAGKSAGSDAADRVDLGGTASARVEGGWHPSEADRKFLEG